MAELPSRIPGRPPGRPQRCPFLVRCEAGRYLHCGCRRSAAYPFCDESCDGREARAVLVDATRTVAWCACGHSQNLPFCDGSHAELP